MSAWLVHYNYFRPHEALDGKTPAEVAGLRPVCRNWSDIVEQSYAQPARTPTERPKITIRLVPDKLPRFTPRTPRLTPRMPRITPRQTRISPKWVSLGGGVVLNTRTGRRHLRLR